jgi:hypothetical protein
MLENEGELHQGAFIVCEEFRRLVCVQRDKELIINVLSVRRRGPMRAGYIGNLRYETRKEPRESSIHDTWRQQNLESA